MTNRYKPDSICYVSVTYFQFRLEVYSYWKRRFVVAFCEKFDWIIEVIKKLESARTPASLAATDAGTRSAHW